jgi:hypothetical protein
LLPGGTRSCATANPMLPISTAPIINIFVISNLVGQSQAEI